MKGICFPTIKDIPPRTKRSVSPHPNSKGIYELGPFSDGALGLGDLLVITPVARALGSKAVMLMPKAYESKACLFDNLCPVRFDSEHPVLQFNIAMEHIAQQVLRLFRLSNVDPIPRIDINPANITGVRSLLSGYQNPIAFCPTCSRGWSHVRQRPPQFWKPIVEELSKRYTVVQFGFHDYPLLPGAHRFPFVPLETLAAAYYVIGNYVGVHTGDYHLMIACGGRVVVAEPDPMPDAGHDIHWNYRNLPKRAQYGKLSHPSTVLSAIQQLDL